MVSDEVFPLVIVIVNSYLQQKNHLIETVQLKTIYLLLCRIPIIPEWTEMISNFLSQHTNGTVTECDNANVVVVIRKTFPTKAWQ